MAEAAVTKGERTKQALLEAAVRRFAQDGYQRTSVSDIARDCSITPAAVYAYFPGKEALFDAALDADAEGLVEVAREALLSGRATDLRAALTDLAERLFSSMPAHPLILRCLSGSEPVSVGAVMDLPSITRLEDEIAGWLEVGQRLGLVRRTLDARQLAVGLVTIVLDLLPNFVLGGGKTDHRWQAAVAILEAAVTEPVQS